jgi:hypothetical protein
MSTLKHNSGQPAKLAMSEVRKFCSAEPYLALVRKAIRNGNGFVLVHSVTNGRAMISGNAYDRILGEIEVPESALIY